MNINKLLFSFAIIFIIGIACSVFTVLEIKKLRTHTQKMYTHPFKVSNAIANIQTLIITMHRNMKDVVLTENSLELIKIIENTQTQEEKVYKNFELIYKSYLGKKENIDKSYNAFKNWKKIREEVISLMYQKKINEAILITKTKGANHIKNLYKQINVLKDFAFDKANEYYELSLENSNVEKIILVFVFSFMFSSLIVGYLIKNLLNINNSNKKQLYLIDQNILIAKLDLDKKIIEISNALCNVLNIKKKDILNTKNEYFFTNEDDYKLFENRIYTGKHYKGEVVIKINNEDNWYEIEILPEFDDDFSLTAFTILLINISDKKYIEKVSITDGLTSLYNRNYFEIMFEKEIKRAKREKQDICVLMFDIDFFKQFNDTYGHQEGDQALKSVANVFLNNCNRPYDYTFRTGGEEFILLTYQKNFELLETFAKKILKDVEELQIRHESSKISKYLTISAGVIVLSKNSALGSDEMYKRVDELLYKAKAEGRNNVQALYLE